MNFFKKRIEKLEEQVAILDGGEPGRWVNILFPDACAPPGTPLPYVLKVWVPDKKRSAWPRSTWKGANGDGETASDTPDTSL